MRFIERFDMRGVEKEYGSLEWIYEEFYFWNILILNMWFDMKDNKNKLVKIIRNVERWV